MDKNLNYLLKWSIENSEASRTELSSTTDPEAEQGSTGRALNHEALKALMSGPSDAQLMQESMAAIRSPEISVENKLVAFDNLEQLIESIDNANNMESLGLWTPLVGQLDSEEPDMRKMAAWCLGTAVQNNVKAQDRMLAVGGVPKLTHLAVDDPSESVRRKSIYALSSEIRNYQPGLDEFVKSLPDAVRPSEKVDAGDMDAIDQIIDKLREDSKNKAS